MPQHVRHALAMAVAAVAENDVARHNRHALVRLGATHVREFVEIAAQVGQADAVVYAPVRARRAGFLDGRRVDRTQTPSLGCSRRSAREATRLEHATRQLAKPSLGASKPLEKRHVRHRREALNLRARHSLLERKAGRHVQQQKLQ